MKKRKKLFQNSILVFITLLLTGTIVFCVIQIQKEKAERQVDADTFEELASISIVKTPSETPTTAVQQDTEYETAQTAPSKSAASARHDLSLLREKNNDCIGWISIAGTALNYPVMHTPDDPEKYLRLNFYEKYSVSGVPFLDYRCSPEQGNLIIYGHNMKNGTMFSTVKDYRSDGFLQKHPTVLLELEDGIHVFEIFAVASLDKSDAWYQFIDADTEENFNARIEEILNKSMFHSDSIPVWGDRLLTLSTCHRNMEINRLVVVAKEIMQEIAE